MNKRIMVLIKHPTKKDPENWNKSSILDNQNLKNVFLWNRLGFKKYVIYITNATDTIIDTIYPVIDTRINSTISDIVGDNSNVQIKIDLIPQNASTSIENLLSFILSNPGFKKLKHHDAFNYIKDEVLFGIVRRSVNRGEGTQLSVAESDKIHLLREYMKFGVELDKLVLGCNNYIHFNISIIGHNHLLSIATTVSLSQLSDRIKTLNKKVKKNTINNLHLLEISTLKWLRQIIRFNECITIHDSHTSSSNNYQQSLLFSNLGHYLLNRKFLGEFYKFKSSRVISNQYHELKQFSYRGNCVEDISIDHSGITVIIKCSVSRYGSFHKIHFSKKRLGDFSRDFILAGDTKTNNPLYIEFQFQWLLLLVKTFKANKLIGYDKLENTNILINRLHSLYAQSINKKKSNIQIPKTV